MWLRLFMDTRIPGVRGQGRPEVCKGPWSLRGSRGHAPHGNMGRTAEYAACCTPCTRHFPLWSLYSDGPLSSGPQPLGVSETTLPAKTQGKTLDCPFNFLSPRFVAGLAFQVSKPCGQGVPVLVDRASGNSFRLMDVDIHGTQQSDSAGAPKA